MPKLSYDYMPKGSDYWQLYCTGSTIVKKDKDEELDVEYHLRKLAKSDGKFEKLTHKSDFLFNEGSHQTVQGGIGVVPALLQGTIIHRKEVHLSPNQNLYHFKKLSNFNVTNRELIQFPHDDFNKTFPPTVTAAWIFKIPGSNAGEFYYLPCTEVFRYFYARTSLAAQLLTNGSLCNDLECICDVSKSKIIDNVANIYVTTDDIKSHHAEWIARLVFDERFRSEAQNCFKYLATQRATNEDAHIKIDFPRDRLNTFNFLGRSFPTLYGWGIWIHHIVSATHDVSFIGVQPKREVGRSYSVDQTKEPTPKKSSSLATDDQVTNTSTQSNPLLQQKNVAVVDKMHPPQAEILIKAWQYDHVEEIQRRGTYSQPANAHKHLSTAPHGSSAEDMPRKVEFSARAPLPPLGKGDSALEENFLKSIETLNGLLENGVLVVPLFDSSCVFTQKAERKPNSPRPPNVSYFVGAQLQFNSQYYYLFEGTKTSTILYFEGAADPISFDNCAQFQKLGSQLFSLVIPKELKNISRERFLHTDRKTHGRKIANWIKCHGNELETDPSNPP